MEGLRSSKRQFALETIEATATLERLIQESVSEDTDNLQAEPLYEDISDFDSSSPGNCSIITNQRGQSGQQRSGVKRKFLSAKDALAAGRAVVTTTQGQFVVGGDEISFDRSSLSESSECGTIVEAKVPRPPNAFMIFANEHRRKLATEFPAESNKDISVRLGITWKSLEKVRKDRYFDLAKTIDAEHKKRYPNYVYNPKEARMRKAIRDQTREHNRIYNGKTPSPKKLAAGMMMHPGDASVKGGMRQVRVLDSKRRSPMMYTPWHETQGQYVTNDGYMEAPYQSQETVNMAQNSWYQYMQQDMSNMPYAQAWAHGPASYMQQRMYSAQDGPSQSYNMTYELPAVVPPAQPVGAQPAKPARTDVRQEVTASSSQAPPATYDVARRPTNQQRQSVKPTPSSNNQDPGSSSSTITPTNAYHRYLTGSDGSPTAAWPCMYPTAEAIKGAPEGRPMMAKSGFNENVHQFTYYDEMPHQYMMQNVRRKQAPNYNPYIYTPPPMMKVRHPYPVSMHQILPMNLSCNETLEQDPVTVRPIEKVDNNAGSANEFTVIVNVLNEAALETKGGRVIATYESQSNDVVQDKNVKILSVSQNKKSKVDFKNETFNFMQDEAYKNILKSIDDDDDVEKPRIIEENANVCVLPNDIIDVQNNFACMNRLDDQDDSK